MNYKPFLIALCLTGIWRQAIAQSASFPPHLERRHGAIQLIVAGKPFTLVCGELHNSTSSAPAYFDAALKNVRQMNVNSVIGSVSWEQFEPEENHFDFTLTDHIIKAVHEAHLKLVLIWFASWKNGESSYMPLWVKQDTKRFFRIRDASGNELSAVSPFCRAAMKADARAFTALMQHIRLKNHFNDVVMVQVENESGAFSDIDHGIQAQALYHAEVPAQLSVYLQRCKSNLDPYIKNAWERNGAKLHGDWADLFGEDSLVAQHLFMTWQYATYINSVCAHGKSAYNLPMYVNAWQDHTGQSPGVYPNGGPVAKVLDIYRAAGPAIDFIAPDIYLPNYRQICDKYFKPGKLNPLFVPECERTNPGKAFYALGQDDAIGFGPFGIESLAADRAYAQSNRVLEELLPLITRYQGTGRMHVFLQQPGEDTALADMGNYHLSVTYTGSEKRSFALVIQTSARKFLIAGLDCRLKFSSKGSGSEAQIGQVLEGGFHAGQWNTNRQLNGDETWHDRDLIVGSRSYRLTYRNDAGHTVRVLAPTAVLNQGLEHGLVQKTVSAPAIYRVKLYDLFPSK